MRFFFHLQTTNEISHDEIGTELDNVEHAYLAACDAIPALASELLRSGENPMRCAFLIHNAADQFLMRVPFKELVRTHPWKEETPRRLPSRTGGQADAE